MNRKQRRVEESNSRRQTDDYLARKRRANRHLKVLMENVYQHLDSQTQIELEEKGYTERVSCRRGCAACCELFVMVSGPEAVLIVEKYPHLIKKVEPILRKQEGIMMDLDINTVNFEDEVQRDRFAGKWFEERQRCAFLNEQNECSIYDARPHACRTYIVIDEDPAICAQRPKEGETILIKTHNSLAGFNALGSVMELMAARYAKNIYMGPLPTMLLAASNGKI
jgi:Fe-S-cluster containining protein